MAKTFRYKRETDVSYADQGYIFFLSKRYSQMTSKEKSIIRQACRDAAGSAHRAVFDYVTSDCDSAWICARHAISESTLERMVRRYYRIMAERI